MVHLHWFAYHHCVTSYVYADVKYIGLGVYHCSAQNNALVRIYHQSSRNVVVNYKLMVLEYFVFYQFI